MKAALQITISKGKRINTFVLGAGNVDLTLDTQEKFIFQASLFYKNIQAFHWLMFYLCLSCYSCCELS